MNLQKIPFEYLVFDINHELDVGSWFLLKASYCDGDIDPLCTEDDPCNYCLEMCNLYVICNICKTIKGYDYLFNGNLCNREGGSIMNSTMCSILTDNFRRIRTGPNAYHISEVIFINVYETMKKVKENIC